MEIDLDALPDDADALRAIIVAQHQALTGMQASNRACEALVQALKIAIARLKKQRFGSSSEKIEREIQQLGFALEELEGARAAADATPEDDGAQENATAPSAERAPQRRRGEPRIAPDAPREIITLDPGERRPDCGGVLRLVGEDVAEILDFIAAKRERSWRSTLRGSPAGTASGWRRPRRRRGRSRAAWRVRRCSRTSSSRSTTTTFPSTDRARSSPGWARTSRAPR